MSNPPSPSPSADPGSSRFTVARAAAAAAIVLAVVVIAIIVVGGGSATTYHLRFQNAGQLVTGDEVQVGGVKVGTIKDIVLTSDNEAEVTVEVQRPFAPLHAGTRAVIRATSLSGIANRYIALTPGPNSNDELGDGATLSAERTTAPVDLDQLFNTLDPQARDDLQKIIQGSAQQYAGRGREANDATRYFSPATSTAAKLTSELVRDQKAFSDLIVSGASVVTALAERRGTITSAVSNTNATAQAIGSEAAALDRTLAFLPATLRQGSTTFVNLRSTLDDLDTLVAASKPATKDLAKFLRRLRPLVIEARPTVRDLQVLLRRPGAANDLADLLVRTPRLAKLAKQVFPRAVATMQRSQPVLRFIRPYAPDLVGWFRDFGQGASTYDANGHYARIQPMFNAYQFNDSPAGGLLTPLDPALRNTGLDTGNVTRCPGGASQATPDGSAPFTDDGKLDCTPSQSPTGF